MNCRPLRLPMLRVLMEKVTTARGWVPSYKHSSRLLFVPEIVACRIVLWIDRKDLVPLLFCEVVFPE